MVRATLSGDYLGVSKGRLALMVAAAGYLVAPIDVLPELFLPVLGLADDALVLSWLATRLVEETEAFLEWEKATMGTSTGAGSGPGAGPGSGQAAADSGSPWDTGASRPASSRVVPGDVVH
jgi:uncharacterized membrane protein YkvA (DUF1232 family)